MIIQLHETDLDLVLDFQLRKLEASGRCKLPAGWKARSAASYVDLYRGGKCRHLAYKADGHFVGLAGALICDETPFLSNQTVRHGLIVDEYVLPEYRNRGIGSKLRQELFVWLNDNAARLRSVLPPNTARLTSTLGCPRL